jgi:hypothetical protein
MTDIQLSPLGAQDHTRGPAGAALTLVEYGDFECPYCRQAHAVVAELERRFAGRLRFVFRQFPLRQIHPHAEAAAEAAEAAAVQGRFWPMYDHLFAQSRALTSDQLRSYAQAAGVPDLERFAQELGRERYRPVLDAAIEQAENSGLEGTPTFFIKPPAVRGRPDGRGPQHGARRCRGGRRPGRLNVRDQAVERDLALAAEPDHHPSDLRIAPQLQLIMFAQLVNQPAARIEEFVGQRDHE